MKRKVTKKKFDTPILSGYAERAAKKPRPGGCDTCGGAFLVLPGSKPGLVRLRIFHAETCPEGLAEAAEYRTAEDTIGEFLADYREDNLARTVPVSTLAADYKMWCEERVLRPAGQRIFTGELRSRGYVDTRTTVAGKTQRAWIFPEASDHAPPAPAQSPPPLIGLL